MVDRNGIQRRWLPRPVKVTETARREADHRVGKLLFSLLDEAGKAEVGILQTRGQYIYAVRRVRELTGLRLIDAKRLVDSLRR